MSNKITHIKHIEKLKHIENWKNDQERLRKRFLKDLVERGHSSFAITYPKEMYACNSWDNIVKQNNIGLNPISKQYPIPKENKLTRNFDNMYENLNPRSAIENARNELTIELAKIKYSD